MHEIKVFLIGLISGIALTLLVRGCNIIRQRFCRTESDGGSATGLGEQAERNNQRIEELEQREAGALEAAERDNQAAITLLEKAKHILDKYNDTSNSGDINTNL